ncbi:hypothetical protein C8R44DRAFT_748533 [Mycena epipterygia]|nr:hypothetical protein C8R44DRAFT_748533 [Mycena epipterygia]
MFFGVQSREVWSQTGILGGVHPEFKRRRDREARELSVELLGRQPVELADEYTEEGEYARLRFREYEDVEGRKPGEIRQVEPAGEKFWEESNSVLLNVDKAMRPDKSNGSGRISQLREHRSQIAKTAEGVVPWQLICTRQRVGKLSSFRRASVRRV